MNSNAANRTALAFDIESSTPHTPSSQCKNALIATCTALAAASLGAVGGMLVLGATARVGPLAVAHDYGTECSYSQLTGQDLGCGQIDNSNDKALTYGFLGFGSLVVAGILANFAVKFAKNKN